MREKLLAKFKKKYPYAKFKFVFLHISKDITIETLKIDEQRLDTAWSPLIDKLKDPDYMKIVGRICSDGVKGILGI